MIITRPSEGLWSSSWAYPIQVDHAGAHGTGPDRFRAIPDDFLMKSRQKYQTHIKITKNGSENDTRKGAENEPNMVPKTPPKTD